MSTLFERGRDMIARVLPAVWVNEAVSLYLRAAADTWGSADAVNAKRGALSSQDQRVQNGLVKAGTVVFILDASTVASAPRPRDKIVDAASVTWFIDYVQKIVMDGELYRCEVTKGV